jgi:hypothetical protein
MEYNTDTQLIINSLTKEKKELTDKIAEIDKVIKTDIVNARINNNKAVSNKTKPVSI